MPGERKDKPCKLSVYEIEDITRVYCATLSVVKTARQTGRSFATVKKYVEEGDPSRDIPAIKSILKAERVKADQYRHPATAMAYTAGHAFDSTTAVFKLIKALIGAKYSGLLKELDDAVASGDAKKIQAAQTKVFAGIRITDMAKIAVAEAMVFEKIGPNSKLVRGETENSTDEDELDEMMNELSAAGLVDKDEERTSQQSEDNGNDEQDTDFDSDSVED
jgi:hypothetical protein